MKKLLIIGYVWPEPNSSAAGTRMLQLISIFQQQGYDINYSSPAILSERMVDLAALGIKQKSIELNNSSFDKYVKDLNPDVVLFDRFMMEEQFSWRLEKECPHTIRLLETVDLHCLREARRTAVKNNIYPYEMSDLELNTDIAAREIASILRCDLSLIISEVEVNILKTQYHVDESLLLYLPFMYESLDEHECKEKWLTYSERKHFVTIGNFRHAPNWDSVEYLKTTVWPLIRKKLKNVELHIYGAYLPKKAQQLHNPKQGFYIKGWAEDALATLSQYKICLSPLRFGAGMKGKLVDAMLSGTPNITTSIGVESMQGEYDWSGMVSDDAEELASMAVELYETPETWIKKQRNGIKIINNRFNKKENSHIFITKLNTIINSLEKHRKNNFTGMMLRHHTMKSAMYMSQWIEEKNKPK